MLATGVEKSEGNISTRWYFYPSVCCRHNTLHVCYRHVCYCHACYRHNTLHVCYCHVCCRHVCCLHVCYCRACYRHVCYRHSFLSLQFKKKILVSKISIPMQIWILTVRAMLSFFYNIVLSYCFAILSYNACILFYRAFIMSQCALILSNFLLNSNSFSVYHFCVNRFVEFTYFVYRN